MATSISAFNFINQISFVRITISIVLPIGIAVWGLKRKSLSTSGALLALLVGFVVTLTNGCLCLSLLSFFFSSSRLTKWKGHVKSKLEPDYKEGGQRDWIQVFCNGFVICIASILCVFESGIGEHPLIFNSPTPHRFTLYCMAGMAAVACCCGDTWASEIGTVMGGEPRLITSGKKVPRGTNGGVTPVGVLVSFAGGLFVGFFFYIGLCIFVNYKENAMLQRQWLTIIIGGVSGVLGSIIDSLLGAILQFSGVSTHTGKVLSEPGPGVDHISGVDVLSNNVVNLVSSLLTALIIPALLVAWIYL